MSEKKIKKEDGRVRYTKMRIRTAYYELLHELDAEKITVTAICTRAEINRATFYKHYLDVQDLTEKLQEEILNSLSERFKDASRENISGFIEDILKYVKNHLKNKEDNVLYGATSGTFIKKIGNLIYTNFSSIITSEISQKRRTDEGAIFAYISSGCAGIIEWWVQTDCRESEEAVTKKLILLSRSTLDGLNNY